MDKSEFAYQGIEQVKSSGPPPSYAVAMDIPTNNPNPNGEIGMGASSSTRRVHISAPPSSFIVKKWLLLFKIFIEVATFVFCLFCVDSYVNNKLAKNSKNSATFVDNDNGLLLPSDAEKDDQELDEAMLKRLTYAMLSFVLLLWCAFAYGVSKQHIGLTTIYAVVTILGASYSMILFLANPLNILGTLVAISFAVVAYSYSKDLRTMRDNSIRLGLNVI